MSDREFEDLESEVKTLSGRRDEAFAVYEPILKEWCAAYHKLSQAKERRAMRDEVRAEIIAELQPDSDCWDVVHAEITAEKKHANVVAEPSAEETND